MENVYDNGALMIGSIDKIIDKVINEIKNDIDIGFVNPYELLKDLKDLKKSDIGVEIVYINYEQNMGNYELNYWTKNDRGE